MPGRFCRRTALAALLAVPALLRSGMARGSRRAEERAPLAHSEFERRVLALLEELYRKHRYLSVPQEDGRLLRLLVEASGAKQVVEVGTSTGYSGLWMLLALSKTGGHLTTYEIDPERQRIAREYFERAGTIGRATLVLGDAHAELAGQRGAVDFAFIDADKEGYLDYFEKLAPRVRPGGLIVAHNMASPPPDPRYLEAITTDPAFETVFLNMHAAGVGVTLKKR